MAHETHHHGVPVPWKLLAHPRAVERMVDWYAVGSETAATEEGYECGVVIIMNPKLYRELEAAATCPEGLLPATIATLHEKAHVVLLRLLGQNP